MDNLFVITQEDTNRRVRSALRFTSFDEQMGMMRIIVRNTPQHQLANCPWYVEWLMVNRDRIREMVALKSLQ